ncbi:MAG: acylphosphatase [Myxococcota bacterium]
MSAGPSTQSVRCLVAGRVQGVYYRSATAQRAQALALRGWVKNLADGRVEVVASGDATAIAALTRWLWQGPPAARVDAVYLEEWQGDVPAEFVVAK